MKLPLFLICAALSAYGQSTYDGPAELPRTTMATSVANTPSPNAPKIVGPTDNLQAALNGAVCGDTFLVDPANVWTGTLQLPTTLNCDAQHWITIWSSGVLPVEGTRLNPLQYSLPKIVINSSGAGIHGGAFVRIVGFEILRTTGSGVVYNLVTPGSGAHDLIFDRSYIHGNGQDETVRGFELSNAYNIGIINSYLAGFHCLAIVGTCGDAQGINFGLSTIVQDHNILIDNNFIEASGENILAGGGTATFNPTDVTITNNTFNKPDSWNPGDPSFVPASVNSKCPGGKCAWIVKNIVEMKNCVRCLVANNIMRGAWAGYTQNGFAILLTAKNPGTCPICAVTDVTVRFNRISHTSNAMQVACGKSDNGAWPAACYGYSIHDNVFADLQFTGENTPGNFLMQISSLYDPVSTPVVMHDVSFDHNSLFLSQWAPQAGSTGHGFLLIGGPPANNALGVAQTSDINFTNNIVSAGTYPVWSTGGGVNNCATTVEANYSTLVPGCWTGNSSFAGNIILSNGTKAGNDKWPMNNYISNSGANIN
jgi:hypothetical protein